MAQSLSSIFSLMALHLSLEFIPLMFVPVQDVPIYAGTTIVTDGPCIHKQRVEIASKNFD